MYFFFVRINSFIIIIIIILTLAFGVLVAVVHTKSLSEYPPGYNPTLGSIFSQFKRPLVFSVGPLVPLFWTTGDAYPGYSKPE